MTTACARIAPVPTVTSTCLRPARMRRTGDRSKSTAPRVAAASAKPRHARNGSNANPRVRMAAPPSRDASLASAAAVIQVWSKPAARRASYSRRKRLTASASRRATCSRSCGTRSHRIFCRLSAAAKSSEARRSPCQSVLAARRPCAPAVSWNDASKSSRIDTERRRRAAGTDPIRLEDDRPDAGGGKRRGARTPGQAASNHDHIGLELAAKRRVGSTTALGEAIQPERCVTRHAWVAILSVAL